MDRLIKLTEVLGNVNSRFAVGVCVMGVIKAMRYKDDSIEQ